MTMAHVLVLNDSQLDRLCENSPDCGCDCMRCEAFEANQRYHRNND